MSRLRAWVLAASPTVAVVSFGLWALAAPQEGAARKVEEKPSAAPSLLRQTDAEGMAKSQGCLTCHQGIEPMHDVPTVKLGCVDCHGGCATATTKEEAHVRPRFPERWPTPGNPQRTFALLNNESPEFIQFVNPGDWRAAAKTCGTTECHPKHVANNPKSLHGHSCMVPGSALYNNGSQPNKIYRYGEIYGPDGRAQRAYSTPRPTEEDIMKRGVLPFLDPLPRFEITQPGNIFRVLEVNNVATSLRGPGTDFRIDAVFLNVVKTKLNDPTMVFMGTNDYPGDYRTSGCSSCHVIYANDRAKRHSEQYAQYGNRGHYAGNDPTIPKNEPGHPIHHRLTRTIPSSQCMSCHFHQGSGALANYYGYIWWDYETDAEQIYPRYGYAGLSGVVGKGYLGATHGGSLLNPDMPDLAREVNPHLKGNRFADFHNAGWLMQAVYKRDRRGRMLDKDDKVVSENDPDWHKRVVHLMDVHMEKGMHCVDCHFSQDCHGNGEIFAAMIDEVEIACKDCHGTISDRANLKTSNPAAPKEGTDLTVSRTAFGERRFVEKGGKIYQRSSVTKGLEWEVPQVKDVITPGHAKYSEAARLAKTIQRDGKTWGHVPGDKCKLAHSESGMTCYACHSSWNTACAGCHLDAYTNLKTDNLHYEGDYSKVYASYNPESNRSDGFYLGVNGTVQGNKVSPARSASGVIVSARDGNRAMVLHQQPTISAEGHSGHAFTPNPPHTVRGKETRRCTDCHVSEKNDNNAVVAQVLGLGIRGVDALGRYVWVAERTKGFEAVRVTSLDDFPQPVIGSDFQRIADPHGYTRHLHNDARLCEAEHHKSCDARSIQRYGEWVLVADGSAGLRIFDIANVANKNVAQRIVESPLSPLGQSLRVRTANATCVALPTVLPMDSCRSRRPENEEQPVNPLFNHAFVTDYQEGLVIVNIQTLVDGNPSNNFLRRLTTFNPGGVLDGAVSARVAGNHLYALCKAGLVVVDVADPCNPRLAGVLSAPDMILPRAIDIQFRYAFICDCEGLKIVDITHPDKPTLASKVPLGDARGVRVMRTYAYIAAGTDGLAIIDVENPTKPREPLFYSANGCINDATAIAVGSTYASLFVYVADGRNGLRVVQVISPAEQGSRAKGFSPDPMPKLIASWPTKGAAVDLSEGLPRDRYVDEDGNQIGVLGRRGSRPFNYDEMRRLYLRDGQLYRVKDEPPGPAIQ